jgi:probable lipoprotein NlpC
VWIAVGCTSAPEPQPTLPQPSPRSSIEQNLRAEAAKWKGTPHRLGGTDHSGIDCSGLVMRVYKDLFGKKLPRTTWAQSRMGRPVAVHALKAGDLVFFDPPGKRRHVGIYLSRGEFVHASYSRGVMISNLHNPYWRRTFWTVRRVL